jgi:tripartite-type tricarboxylate transporter receptor subunit TctC
VAKAQPDGHTVLLSSPGPLAINQFLYARLGYDPARDFVPVSLLAAVPIMLVAHPARPFQTLSDLISYAKANPGKLSYGSQGNGTTSHLTMELLKQQAGIDIVHVPYRGSAPAAAALIGGQIDLMFDNSPSTWPQVQGGKMKAIAVATQERVPTMPDIPAVSEQLKGFESTAWFAIVAPKGTPDSVSATLNSVIDTALKSADMREKLGASGVTLLGGTQATLASYIDGEREKWSAVVKKSGAKVDG